MSLPPSSHWCRRPSRRSYVALAALSFGCARSNGSGPGSETYDSGGGSGQTTGSTEGGETGTSSDHENSSGGQGATGGRAHSGGGTDSSGGDDMGGASGSAGGTFEVPPEDVGFAEVEGYSGEGCHWEGELELDVEGVLGTSGEFCSAPGALGCDSADSSLALICQSGAWTVRDTCDAAETCNRKSGLCELIADECESRGGGNSFCTEDQTNQCGIDRVTLEADVCCGGCNEGACLPPSCGDGKLQSPETCDDSNLANGDGCDVDCQPSLVGKLEAGGGHTCAILRSGALRCWGGNEYGQLGQGHTRELGEDHPYQVPEVQLGGAVKKVRLGSDHSCAIMRDDTLQCWGRNHVGQLGLGHTESIGDDEEPRAAVSRVFLGQAAVDVAVGKNTTCVALSDGQVKCWGDNQYGQLGQGNTKNSATPRTVNLTRDARLVSVDGDFACAVMGEHAVQCWGFNDHGELGLGTVGHIGDDEHPSEEQIVDIPYEGSVEWIDSGGWRSGLSYTLPVTRAIKWGYNGDGGLGIQSTGGDPTHMLERANRQTRREYSFGGGHICSFEDANETWCYGLNQKGQLGTTHTLTNGGSPGANDGPLQLGVRGDGHPRAVKMIATGEKHTCVLLASSDVLCWGHNDRGQLGLGHVSAGSKDYVGGDPSEVPSLLPLVQVLP